MVEEIYHGSSLLQSLAISTGIRIDQLNFLMCQLLALLISCVMRKYLHPSTTSTNIRHAFSCSVGLLFVYFCFGSEIWILLLLSLFSYVIIWKVNAKYSQIIVFVVSILYLAARHMDRMIFNYGSYTLDITGPLMITVQKLSGLGFSIHDGIAKQEKDLPPYRKKYVVKTVPTLLEFFGYVFQYQCILAGPNVFYSDYLNFITGDNFKVPNTEDGKLKQKPTEEPSPMFAVLNKVAVSFTCIGIHFLLAPHFPSSWLKDQQFLGNGFLYKIGYLFVSTTLVRMMYYHAWILADAICNASGFGFNGFDDNGKPIWDLTTNIEIYGFELGENIRSSIGVWNLGTNMWLRFIVYERIKSHNTLLTFLLSAFWHGLYPGYYLAFTSAALFVSAARTARKHVRPYFLESKLKKVVYDVVTIVATRLALMYFATAFILLEFWSAVRLYQSLYFFMHIGALLCLACPYIIRRSIAISIETNKKDKKLE